MQDIINNAAEIIRHYNAPLADCWLSQPFRREAIARAFSRGFVKNVEDDPPSFCLSILRAAMLDKRMRAAGMD